MADRRIDQLTEAEDISDEDLFVIWKQNISQTRSIAKGTMNLATKSYVDNSVPDWSNATQLAEIPSTGYIIPNNGIIIVKIKTNDIGFVYINDVEVCFTSTGDATFDFVIPVGKGDRLTYSGLITRKFNFVPYKNSSSLI